MLDLENIKRTNLVELENSNNSKKHKSNIDIFRLYGSTLFNFSNQNYCILEIV